MREEEEEILLEWKFEIEVETQDFIILFVWVVFAVYLCLSFVFSQNGALVTSKKVASVDKAMRGYVIEKWSKLENWPN